MVIILNYHICYKIIHSFFIHNFFCINNSIYEGERMILKQGALKSQQYLENSMISIQSAIWKSKEERFIELFRFSATRDGIHKGAE